MSREEPDARALRREGEEPGALPPETEAFLYSFSNALQRYSLYPSDHPAVRPLAESLTEELRPVLEAHGELALAVSPSRLRMVGTETTEEQTPFRAIAGRLHGHDVARLTFLPGTTPEEFHQLLSELMRVPESEEERLARRMGMVSSWPRIMVEPVRYDALTLGTEEERGTAGAELSGEERAARLWLGMARAVGLPVPEEREDGELTSPDAFPPAALAEALRERVGDEDVTYSTAAQLHRIVEALAGAESRGLSELRARFAELVEALGSELFREVLERGTTDRERQQILLTSAGWLPVETVVDLVEKSAEAGELDVSRWMLRLFAKMGRHARSDRPDVARRAESTVRSQARQAFSEWTLDHRSLEEYRDEPAPAVTASRTSLSRILPALVHGESVQPGLLLKTAIEVDTLGEAGESALEELLDVGRAPEILDLLDHAPKGGDVAPEVWARLSTRDTLERMLGSDPPELDAVERVVRQVGPGAAPPLLDHLEEAESRSVRHRLFTMVARLGPPVVEELVRRLDDDRWYVRRNMLALLHEVGILPEDFQVARFARDEHAAVRVEAYKLMLDDPELRKDGIRMALREDEPRAVSLAVSAIDPPPSDEQRSALLHHLHDLDTSPQIKVQIVRLLREEIDRRTCRALADFCRADRKWWQFWKPRLAPKDLVVVEALKTLASSCRDEPRAAAVLSDAAESTDADLRAAARPEGE